MDAGPRDFDITCQFGTIAIGPRCPICLDISTVRVTIVQPGFLGRVDPWSAGMLSIDLLLRSGQIVGKSGGVLSKFFIQTFCFIECISRVQT